MQRDHAKTKRMVATAILAALVVVLQLMSYLIKIGTFNLSLVLIPVVLGAVLYGPYTGMILGLVFGAVTVAATVSGMDQGAFILFSANPAITVAICFVKGGMAGLCAGLAARSLKQKNVYVSCIFAAITAPIVNTGLFCLAMEMFFHKILVQWAGGTDLVYYVFFGLIGINFLIELGINIVFAPVLIRIIRAVNKTGGHSENPYA